MSPISLRQWTARAIHAVIRWLASDIRTCLRSPKKDAYCCPVRILKTSRPGARRPTVAPLDWHVSFVPALHRDNAVYMR